MRNCCLFVITVMLAAAGAGSIACSDDNDSSSPLQPSPLATAPAGAGPRGAAGGGPEAPPAGPAAGDDPGISRVAPLPQGFNAYDARIEYRDGEVTITFVPVDMPKMPDAAREYRNRAVTVWQCPVEPHHVSQACGEPVFRDSFAFAGSPSRTFPLADCAGWLVIEAAELSDDFYDGWRNAPLACRQDEEGRTVADVDTGGGGAGWEDSRFDPPVRGSRPSAQSVVDAAIFAAGGLQSNLAPVSVAVRELFAGTEGTTGAEYMATSSDTTVVTVEVTDNPQVVITPVAPGTATITIVFLRTEARVEFDVTVAPPAWRSLGAADLHVLDRRTSGFSTPAGSRIELSSFTAWAIRGMPGHVLFEWRVSRGSLAPAPRTWRDCRVGIHFDADSNPYNRYQLKAGWFETGVARPLPAPYGPTASVENPPFLDVWNTSGTVLRALADLRRDTLANAAFVKRAGTTAPHDATEASFSGFCNNYVLSENMEGQLVVQPDASDHRSVYWTPRPRFPYPITFSSSSP